MSTLTVSIEKKIWIYARFAFIRVFSRFFKNRHVKIDGKVTLIAPSNNRFDIYTNLHPLYDRALPLLAKITSEFYPQSEIIDVGANIGDTIALFRLSKCQLKVIAVEASKKYFSYLQKNIQKDPTFYGEVELINAFVGREEDSLELVENNATAGTVIKKHDSNKDREVPVIPLSQFRSRKVSLIKIDTDGYDATILSSNKDYLREKSPVVFAEAEVNSEFSLEEWTKFLNSITSKDFEHIVALDSFGFPFCAGKLDEQKKVILSTLQYIHNQFNKVKPTIYYLDICLFPASQEKIYLKFKEELETLTKIKL